LANCVRISWDFDARWATRRASETGIRLDIENPEGIVYQRDWFSIRRGTRECAKFDWILVAVWQEEVERTANTLVKRFDSILTIAAEKDNEMKHQFLDSTAVLAFTLAVVSLAPAPVAGQTRLHPGEEMDSARTPDGQPDLQGIWSNATITPFERPRSSPAKSFLQNRKRPTTKRESFVRAIGIFGAALPPPT